MKRAAVLVLVLAASFVCNAAEVTVTTEAQLQAAIDANEDTPIHLNASSFILTSDLTMDYSGTIDNVSGGPVTIDGNDYKMTFMTDTTATTTNVTGTSDSERIQFVGFTDGNGGVQAYSNQNVQLTLNMTYCDINDCNANNFSVLSNPSGNVTVNFDRCDITNAHDDGFSLLTGNSNNKIIIGCVVDCNITDNGTGTTDQGLTLHSDGQYMYIDNCTITGNAASGFATGIAGSGVIIKNSTIYNNNLQNSAGAPAEILLDEVPGFIENCIFPDLNDAVNSDVCISTDNEVVVKNCIFRDHESGHCIYIRSGGSGIVEGNYFIDVAPKVNQYLMFSSSGAGMYFLHNTAYNFYYGVSVTGVPGHQIRGNIFVNGTARCVRSDNYEYQYNTANGYNYFYNTTGDVFYPSGMTAQDTDVIGTDPQLVDPANDDLRLKLSSPCIGAAGDGRDIGAEPFEALPIYTGKSQYGVCPAFKR